MKSSNESKKFYDIDQDTPLIETFNVDTSCLDEDLPINELYQDLAREIDKNK